MKDYLAHVARKEDSSWADPHLLVSHLQDVQLLVGSFLLEDSKPWGELAGKWHDLGKFQAAFQEYIRSQSGYERENAHIELEGKAKRVVHSTAGAMHAIKTIGAVYGHFLAYLIAGHHAGLPDWSGGQASLSYRLGEQGLREYNDSLAADVPKDILSGQCPQLPKAATDPDACALWMRMVFSALVDADFLDTELYMQPEQAENRKGSLELIQLYERFQKYMVELQMKNQSTPLNSVRNVIYQSCLEAAKCSPGVFSLTVPTGGGKTLSSLGFALQHAKLHGKKRIIYAIPFTSIIEQNADVFRQVLGSESVLEHHSNLDLTEDQESARSRLASENWDAPLIVTTNVQLFESLHAAKTSRCRKLHNLQNAVIVLDEAQQIPRDFHAPIVRAMKMLTQYFGVTWVLCTATQPDFSTQREAISNKTLMEGFDQVIEIYPDPKQLAKDLKRVDIELPIADRTTSWPELAAQLMEQDCVLAIVNTRRHARELFGLLPEDSNSLHLSAQMCAEHRTAILKKIKQRLEDKKESKDDRPLRVISTQLVEAGVDVDFPVVYRAMAGLDSIAQSAGRCNREGKLKSMGRVVVFNPQQPPPVGFLRQAQQATSEMLKTGQLAEPLTPGTFKQFFKLLNQGGPRDKHQINKLLTPTQDETSGAIKLQFRDAAKAFRLIDDAGESVIVPYIPEGLEQSPVYQWLEMLQADPGQKWIYPKLQRYTITLPEAFVKQLQRIGVLYPKAGQWVVEQCNYCKNCGLVPPDILLSAEESII